MNALDIYPAFSWWICGETAGGLSTTRQRLEVDAAAEEAGRRAFFLTGDAAAFDLIPETFDEIVVRYEPTPLKRLVLERHAQAWLRPGATIRFEPERVETLQDPANLESSEIKLSVYSPAA